MLSIHWGMEHVHYPAIEHITLAKKILNYKASFMHRHHPHVIQGKIVDNGNIAAFSLGNSLFDKSVSLNGKIVVEQFEENKECIIVEIEISDGRVKNYKLIAMRDIDNGVI